MSDTEKKETKTSEKAEIKVQNKAKTKSGSDEKKPLKKVAAKAKPKAKSKVSTISITLKKSAIGRPKDQKATLIGLGFKRLNQTVVLKDTPETRGMIGKVSHLVTVD